MSDEELQEIVKEYFKQQEESKLMLCIYEEKASNDIEWYYDGYDWCYLKTKKYKEKIGDETIWGTKLIVEKKRIKTFIKKCHVVSMSFDNYMAIDYMKFKNVDNVDTDIIHHYANNFMKLKKEKSGEGINFTINDYHEYLKHKEIENEKQIQVGCRNFFLWILTTLLILVSFAFPVMLIVAILMCPLTWNLIMKVQKKS